MEAEGRLITAEDMLLDPAYERGELWDGAFVVREPAGVPQGVIEFNVSVLLRRCQGLMRFARVLGSNAGFVVARGPDRVLAPHGSVLSRLRQPEMPRDAFVEGPPDLAVEIRAQNDAWDAVMEKGGVWIGHGARLVWCADPESRTVVAMRPGQAPEPHDVDQRLSLEPLSDDTIAVRAIFQGLL
ncbi:MAG: Uma2 family endonuclease [Planctomycetota bacterium]|nr:Uma2 family endonuclease [Planctomycetota bacterium]